MIILFSEKMCYSGAGLGNDSSTEYALFYHSLQSELAGRLGVNASQLVLTNIIIPGASSSGGTRHLLGMDVRIKSILLVLAPIPATAPYYLTHHVLHAAQVPIMDGYLSVENVAGQWRQPKVVRRQDDIGAAELGTVMNLHEARHGMRNRQASPHQGRGLLQTSSSSRQQQCEGAAAPGAGRPACHAAAAAGLHILQAGRAAQPPTLLLPGLSPLRRRLRGCSASARPAWQAMASARSGSCHCRATQVRPVVDQLGFALRNRTAVVQCKQTHAGVPWDCQLHYKPVPVSADGVSCSGRGTPVPATGSCRCYAGFDGAACEACANGYVSTNGLCQVTQRGMQAQAALSSQHTSRTVSKKISKVRPPDISSPAGRSSRVYM